MKIKISFILAIIAGLLMILTGFLTALKITPPIAAVGAEVGLGVWRVIAGVIVLSAAYIGIEKRIGNWGVIIMGIFEIIVFAVERDYNVLIIGPFIAIIAGALGMFESKKKNSLSSFERNFRTGWWWSS